MPPESIACPTCGRVSHNPNDVLHQYCGFCHRFHSEMRELAGGMPRTINSIQQMVSAIKKKVAPPASTRSPVSVTMEEVFDGGHFKWRAFVSVDRRVRKATGLFESSEDALADLYFSLLDPA